MIYKILKFVFLLLLGLWGLCGQSHALDYDISTGVAWPSYNVWTRMEDVEISSDGSNIYVLRNNGYTAIQKYILQYSLSTPYDVSTATYVASWQPNFDLALEFCDFSFEGGHVYCWGFASHTVKHYTLSTPWDITTTSYSDEITNGSYAVLDSAITSDGGHFYRFIQTTLWGGFTIEHYTLPTPFYLTGASLTDSILIWLSSSSLEVSGDWSFIFFSDSAFWPIRQYSITWYDISTMTSVSALSVSSVSGFDFSSNWAYLYRVPLNTVPHTVYSYDSFSGSLDGGGGYTPPSWSNCYTQLMNSGYEFINKSVLGKNQADYTQYYNVPYDGNSWHARVWYSEDSTGEKHVYGFFNMYNITDYTAVDWFTSADTFNFESSPYPWDYEEPYISASRYGWIEYIKVYGSGSEVNHNDFKIWVFASNSINVEGEKDYLLGQGQRFNFNEYIDFSQYTDDTIYAIVVFFDKYGGVGDLFGTSYEIGGIEYWPYSITQTEYTICIEPDGTVTRDGVEYTGSLDESWDLPPLPTVGTETPQYSSDLDGIFQAIVDFFGEIWSRISSIKDTANNLIQLMKEILKLGNTDEVRTISFIPKANAWSISYGQLLTDKIEYVEEGDNFYNTFFRFGVRGVIFILLVGALGILLI